MISYNNVKCDVFVKIQTIKLKQLILGQILEKLVTLGVSNVTLNYFFSNNTSP